MKTKGEANKRGRQPEGSQSTQYRASEAWERRRRSYRQTDRPWRTANGSPREGNKNRMKATFKRMIVEIYYNLG